MEKNETNRFTNVQYGFKDAVYAFLNVLIWPVLFTFVYIIFLVLLARGLSVSYEELIAYDWVKNITNIFTELVFLGTFLLYNYKHRFAIFTACKVQKRMEPFRVLVVIAIAFVALYGLSPFISLMDYVYTLFGFVPDTEIPIALNTIGQFLWAVFAIAILPPVVEEFIFRGLILNGLRTKLSPWRAILWSAAFFTLMHGSLQQTLYQFVLGVLLAYVVLYSGNLLYGIILHFLNNLIIVINAYVAVQQNVTNQVQIFTTFGQVIIPIIWLLAAAAVLVGLCKLFQFHRFDQLFSFTAVPKEKRQAKKAFDANIIVVQPHKNEKNKTVVIELSDQPKTLKTLNSFELKLFIITLSLGIVMWIINTLGVIFNW